MVMMVAAVSCSFGCLDARLLLSIVCEHAPSHSVRREDAVQSAGSSCHRSSARCPQLRWRLPLGEGTTLRTSEGIAASLHTLQLSWKRGLCMLSSASEQCQIVASLSVICHGLWRAIWLQQRAVSVARGVWARIWADSHATMSFLTHTRLLCVLIMHVVTCRGRMLRWSSERLFTDA